MFQWPLTENQLSIYLDIKVNNKKASYLVTNCFDIDKKYCKKDILNAIERIQEYHPILKSRICYKETEPWLESSANPTVKIFKNNEKNNIRDFCTDPFDLEKGLCKFAIIDNKNSFFVLTVIHHLIFDGYSSFVFENDFNKILNDFKLNEDLVFLDYLEFNDNIKKSEIYKDAEVFYDKEFCDPKVITGLIPDVGENSPSFEEIEINLDDEIVSSFVKKHKISKNVLFTSAFAYTLSRFTNSSTAYFTMIENGRDKFNADEAIGMFVNTLPIVIDCSEDFISGFIKKSKEKIYQTINYNFYPFRLLKNKYNLNADIRFQYQPNLSNEIDNNANNWIFNENLTKRTSMNADLSFTVTDNSINVFSCNKYSKSMAKRILLTYGRILDEILIKDKLNEINYTLEADIKTIDAINQTETKLKFDNILHAFKHSVEVYPNNTMLRDRDFSLSYSEASNWILQLISFFESKKIKKYSNIVVFANRSYWYQLSALAIMNYNCVYVPLNSSHPKDQIKFIIEDTHCSAILFSNETKKDVNLIIEEIDFTPELINFDNVKLCKTEESLKISKIEHEDSACILYTSGSTGKPKGTILSHLGIVNNAQRYITLIDNLNHNDILALYAAFSFDCSLESMFSSIFVGACLDIIPDEIKLEIPKLLEYIKQRNITNIHFPTALINVILEHKIPSCVKSVVVGGAALGAIDYKNKFDFIDAYGPTEAANNVTAIRVNDKIHSSSIGKPLINSKAYILDKEKRIAPFGAIGELYLSSYQLAKGYLNRKKDNDAAFFDNPFCNISGHERIYRTGDIARYLPDGTIGYLGREDSQVKIRGNRVELKEVEASIREIKEINDVTVQVLNNGNNKELVAYVVSDNKSIKDIIIEHISTFKPAYMVPSHVLILDKIPLNVNGKVDINSLPSVNTKGNKTTYIEPRNSIEKVVCSAFAQVFNINKIGIDDDFNLLGGDSIKAIRLVSILNNSSLIIEASQVLSLRTPRAISEVVIRKKAINYSPISGKVPLLPIQEYFFDKVDNKENYNQYYVVESNESLDIKHLQDAFNKLTNIQDQLRATYTNSEQIIMPVDTIVTKIKQITVKTISKERIVDEINKSIDCLSIKNNHLIDIKLINNKYIIFVIHHLIIDGVSWSILLDNLSKLYKGEEVVRPYPYADYANLMKKNNKSVDKSLIKQYKKINSLVNEDEIKGCSLDFTFNFKSNYHSENFYEISENDYLFLAVSRAYKKTYKKHIVLKMESHGRNHNVADVNNTIGWFTVFYPMLFDKDNGDRPEDIIKNLYDLKDMTLKNKYFADNYLIACYYLKEIKFKNMPVTFNFLNDEFSYTNKLFSALTFNGDDDKFDEKINRDRNTYGISLNISKHNDRYYINGECAFDTYLSEQYKEFLSNIEAEAALISKALKKNIYVYPLYEEPLGIYIDENVNNKQNAYSCFDLIKLNNDIDIKMAKNRINELITQHPVLKTRILSYEGVPYGITDADVSIKVLEKSIETVSEDELIGRFDFGESLCNFYIIKDKVNLYIAYNIHHMICDASSRLLVNNELINGVSENLDLGFIKKTNQWLESHYSNEFEKASTFYEKEFTDNSNIVELIADVHNSYGGYARVYLGDIKEKINDVADNLSITVNHIFTSVFAYTLSRFTNTDNTYFTFTNHGRDIEGLESAFGMYVKVIPIVVDNSNQKVEEYLKNSTKNILDAMKYSILSFRMLASKYKLNQNIVFEYNKNLNTIDDATEKIQYLSDSKKDEAHTADLIGVINDYNDGYVFSVEHSSKYSKDTAIRFVNTYRKILEGFLSEVYLKNINYSLKEDIKLIDKINATETPLKYNDILEAFNNSLKEYPNNILVSYLDTKYTYSESAKWINNLTDKLRDIHEDSNIAIFVHRSHYYLLTALSVLNLGCAYVPIDDSYPDERIKFMIKDSDAKVILTTNETIDRAKQFTDIQIINVSEIDFDGVLKPLNVCANKDKVAAILYTSGTTGISKGALLTRYAFNNICSWYVSFVNFNSKDIFSMFCSYSFDVHILSIFSPMYKGGSIDIMPEDCRKDIFKIQKHFNEYNITHGKIPAALVRLILKNDISFKYLKTLFAGGEYLGEVSTENLTYKLYDSYGPTESTVSVSAIEVKEKIDNSSIGKIIPNNKFYILDREKRQAPFGAIGELYISGYQLAKGYLNRDKENKEAFFDNPYDGEKPGYERMYKTGDIVRYLPDGTFGFVGRADLQVKIRGNRVELGDVESAIREIKEVQDVTVQTILNNNNKELVAYVVSEDKDIKNAIIDYMTINKPAFMIPNHVVVLNKIPLNLNGKVDKRALPEVDVSANKVTYIAPTNDTEKEICNAFEKIFNIERVGINDDFFILGGDSLAAIKLISIIKNSSISYVDIFNLRTVKKIAKKINDSSELDNLDLDMYKKKV